MELDGTWRDHAVVGRTSARLVAAPDRERRVLGLRLLGEIEVLRDGTREALPPSRKTRALLAYLAATGKPHRRERNFERARDVHDRHVALANVRLGEGRPRAREKPRRDRIVELRHDDREPQPVGRRRPAQLLAHLNPTCL